MINNISLQPLRNGAYIQFLTDTLHIVSKNNAEALNVSAKLSATDEIEKLFKINHSSLVTAKIENLERRRDDATTRISLHVQSLTYSADTHSKT